MQIINILRGRDENVINLHSQSDFLNLKLVGVGILAFTFPMFEGQVQTRTVLHRNGQNKLQTNIYTTPQPKRSKN